ncbi:MAG: GrdX family protein [Tissierellales bacterium]|nr:GrdX family protein [Tissierellales bacterium]
MSIIIITNNPKVFQKFNGKYEIEYLENESYLDVLLMVRDKLHKGHKLLSHPLSGSVKPNETPFKSILISQKKGKIDFGSLSILENSIATYEKFIKIKRLPDWNQDVVVDFMVVDLSLLENTLVNIEFTELLE